VFIEQAAITAVEIGNPKSPIINRQSCPPTPSFLRAFTGLSGLMIDD